MYYSINQFILEKGRVENNAVLHGILKVGGAIRRIITLCTVES